MGSSDCVCTDKTGTLTKNEMTVTSLWNMDSIVVGYQKKKSEINLSNYVPESI